MIKLLEFTFLVSIFCSRSFGANILGIIAFPSLSHQIPFQPLWKELSLRGHKVTVITTHPIRDPSLTNLTEIDIHYMSGVVKNISFFDQFKDSNFQKLGNVLVQGVNRVTKALLEDNDVKNLLGNEYVFDLLVTEVHMPTASAFAWKFQCPWIGITSMDAPFYYYYIVGNPVHPVFSPDFYFKITNPNGLTFIERFNSWLYGYLFMDIISYGYMEEVTDSLRGYFGDTMPPLREIVNNMSLLFLTTHPMTHDIRPLQTNTIQIGTGMHIKEYQNLPKDIQDFMDNAPEGVIYFSFGSNVMHEMLTESFFKNIVDGLGELPYKVLFKIDVTMETVPKNFKLGKWMPQQDILHHKNLKLFITHGGLQSLQETIYNGVPIIVLPLFGDGFSNANKAARMGYGLKLDTNNLSKQMFKEAVEEVIKNPYYREKIQEAMRIFRDEEIPSLQRAVYWTEYVIRHKGARHLRNPYMDVPAWKYYMLDIFGTILFVSVIILFVVYKIVKKCCYFLFRSKQLKTHKE